MPVRDFGSLLDLEVDSTCALTKALSLDSNQKSSPTTPTKDDMTDRANFPALERNKQNWRDKIAEFPQSYPMEHSQLPGLWPQRNWYQPGGEQYQTPNVTPAQNITPVTPCPAPVYKDRYDSSGYNPYGEHVGNILPTVPFQRTSTGLSGLNYHCYIPQEHLNAAYGYAFDRGNGQVTRLIPVDLLPPLVGIPKTQGPNGLIVLPIPNGLSPATGFGSSTEAQYEFTPSIIGDGRPTSRPTDLVQTTIDAIVNNQPPKKVKVFCDKWLHDGTCAFTQQGCRYKHEMPLDRPTQLEVGLFNGIPGWYRRQQASDLRSRSPITSTSPSQPTRGTFIRGGSWRGGRSGVLGPESTRYSPPLATGSPSNGQLSGNVQLSSINSNGFNNTTNGMRRIPFSLPQRPARRVENSYEILREEHGGDM